MHTDVQFDLFPQRRDHQQTRAGDAVVDLSSRRHVAAGEHAGEHAGDGEATQKRLAKLPKSLEREHRLAVWCKS